MIRKTLSVVVLMLILYLLPIDVNIKVCLVALLLIVTKDSIYNIVDKLGVVLVTLPRDLTAVAKLVRLGLYVKKAERDNITVPKMFYRTVQRCPNKVFFHYFDQSWTFKQVDEYSNKVAHYFQSEGFSKGDIVSVFMSNRPEFVCTWLGLSKIGVIPALINYNLKDESLLHSIQIVKSRAVIFSGELSSSIKQIFGLLANGSQKYPTYCSGLSAVGTEEKVPGSVQLDDFLAQQSSAPVSRQTEDSINFTDKLMYIYTSGTTGMPKAAVIKHARYVLAGGGLSIMVGAVHSDIVYCPLPLYHSVGGMVSLSGCMANGITMVMRDKFSASKYWADCVKFKVTVGQYIGELCRYLINSPKNVEETQHGLRLMFGNGLRPDIWQEFVDRFNIPHISEFYGSTEGNSNIINIDNTVGAVGFVPVLFSSILPLGPIKVQDDGEAVRDPKTGLCVRCEVGEPGEFVGIIQQNHPIREFTGYSDKESTNKKVLTDVWRKGDRCFRSGDILVSDKYGYLYFRDRQGDTFRWKGENVSTAEVESVISGVSDLTDVVVYGVTVPGTDGRVGMAAMLPGGDLDNLATDLTDKLPVYARPAFLRIVKELDMTGTYKLKKKSLQSEGFDPDKITDKLYFLDHKLVKYVPLVKELFTNIVEGRVRL